MLALLGLYYVWEILADAEKFPTLYVVVSWFQEHWYWYLRTRNISNIYVSRLCI